MTDSIHTDSAASIDETLRARLADRVAARAHPAGPAKVHDSQPVPPAPREVDQLLDAAAEARLGLLRPRA